MRNILTALATVLACWYVGTIAATIIYPILTTQLEADRFAP